MKSTSVIASQMLSGRRPDFVRKTMQVHHRCTQLGHSMLMRMCLEEELCRQWKFVFDALRHHTPNTKLRDSSSRLHGVFEQSRLFEPTASSMLHLL